MATFSLNDTIRRVVGTGNGSNPDFNFSFQVNATTDIKVFVDDVLKTLSTHYTIVDSSSVAGLNTDGSGTVKFTAGNIPANNALVSIISDLPLSRSNVYSTGVTSRALH